MRRPFAATLAALALTVATASAQQAPSGPSTPAPADTPDAFGAQVRAYLLTHPEVIVEAVQILQQRQQAAQAEATKGVIAARADEIFRDPASPVGGNPEGDVSLVEFFDYNCQYCRAVAPILVELGRTDPGLRLVYKEFPILGPGSEMAARAALAAERQGKYQALHTALMQAKPPLTEENVFAAAAATGLDADRLRRDMADPGIVEAIARNHTLAAELGITGTPGFVIGDRVVPGAVDQATLAGLLAEAREKPRPRR